MAITRACQDEAEKTNTKRGHHIKLSSDEMRAMVDSSNSDDALIDDDDDA